MLNLLLVKDEFFDALGYIIISYLTECITDYSEFTGPWWFPEGGENATYKFLACSLKKETY